MTQVSLIDANQSLVDTNGKPTTSWYTFFHDVWMAVRGGMGIALGGTTLVNTIPASNTSTDETDLMTYTVRSKLLSNNGDELYIKAWGTFAANANNKTVKLVFGSQTILTTGAPVANDGSWMIEANIFRKTVTSQEIIASIISSSSTVVTSSTRTAGTQDLNESNIIRITGQGGASNDITEYALIVKITPNN